MTNISDWLEQKLMALVLTGLIAEIFFAIPAVTLTGGWHVFFTVLSLIALSPVAVFLGWAIIWGLSEFWKGSSI